MLRGVAIMLVVLSWAGLAAADDLRTVTLLEGRAELSVPKTFERMTDEIRRIKYPTNTPPQDVYTDEDGTVNVAASVRAMPAPPKMTDVVAAISESVGRARNVSKWHDKGTRMINGREFGFLEFTVVTLDTEVYNYIYFTFDRGQFIMFTVNSTTGKLDAWKETLKAVVASTRVIAAP